MCSSHILFNVVAGGGGGGGGGFFYYFFFLCCFLFLLEFFFMPCGVFVMAVMNVVFVYAMKKHSNTFTFTCFTMCITIIRYYWFAYIIWISEVNILFSGFNI